MKKFLSFLLIIGVSISSAGVLALDDVENTEKETAEIISEIPDETEDVTKISEEIEFEDVKPLAAGTGGALKATSGGYWHESMAQYQDYSYDDPNYITDETFFGVWDTVSGSWLKKPYIDYSLHSLLRQAEEYVKQNDYTAAKEVIFEYYKEKFLAQPRSYGTTNDRRQIIAAEIQFDNMFFNSATGFNTLDRIAVSAEEKYYNINVIEEVQSAASGTSKTKTFLLLALKKDGYEAAFNSMEADENTPYLEVDVNGQKRTYYPVKDTMLQAGASKGKNFGKEKVLRVQEDNINQNIEGEPIGDNTKRMYIAFDFSDLNDGDIITSAEMYIYGNTSKPEGTKDIIVFSSTNSNWNETTATWSNTEHLIFSYDGESGPKWKQPADAGYRFHEEMNRFENYMSIMMRRYRYEKNEVYAYHGLRLFLDFICKRGSNPGYYNNLDLGVRSQTTPTLLAYFMESEFMTVDVFIPILKFAWAQGNALVLNWNNKSQTSNWGAYETAGLSNLAINFREFYDAVDETLDTSKAGGRGGWLVVSAYRYELLGGEILNDDGSCTEVSLGYTSESIGNSMQQVSFAESAGWSDFQLAENLQDRLNGLAKYLVNASGPGFSDFQQGNAYAYTHSYLGMIKNVEKVTKDPLLTWAVSGGKEGDKPDYTSIVYPTGKKAVLRSDWTDNATALQINVDGGVHSHGHFDDLGLNMFAKGQYLLVDPRYMNYDNNNPYRAWLNSTRAHNTIEINDMSQRANSWNFSETVKGPEGETLIMPTGGKRGEINYSELNDSYDYVSMTTPNYLALSVGGKKANVEHTRNVLFLRPDYAIVTDYLDPKDNSVNKYSQGWHMLPDADITMDNDSYITKTNFNEANIQVIPVQQESEFKAEIKDGYYSYGTGNVTDAKYVTYEKTLAGKTTFNTVLLPTDAGAEVTASTQNLLLDVDETAANAFSLIINNSADNENIKASYYTLLDKSKKAERNFGEYKTDGTLAFAQDDDYGYNKLILQNGTTLSRDGKQLIYSKTEIDDIGIDYNASDIFINTSKEIKLEDITLYADGKKISAVKLNGKDVELFEQQGNYIYFGNEPLIPDDGEIEKPDDKPSGNIPSGGSNHGSSSGSSGGSGASGGGNPSQGTGGAVTPPITTPGSSDNNPFENELKNHWAKNEITDMINKKIVTGDVSGSLNLQNPVTRAEFITMIIRALDIPLEDYNGEFEDIHESDWYADYCAAAKNNGIMQGDGKNANPNDTITREEMAVMLINAYEKTVGDIGAEENKTAGFDDSGDISEWAVDSVNKALNLSLMNGIGGNVFSPQTSALREQAIVVIYRVLSLIKK